MNNNTIRTLARLGYTINGETSNPRALPQNAPRRIPTDYEVETTTKYSKVPWFHWIINCSHGRLLRNKCTQCERVGITPQVRKARFDESLAKLHTRTL